MRKKAVLIFISVFLVIILASGVILAFLFLLGYGSVEKDGVAFTVLQITDVHLRNDKRDKKVFDTVDKLIAASAPDLIILTGDLTSEFDNKTSFMTFGEYMEGKKIPWTFTFGNHDAEPYVNDPDFASRWNQEDISDYLEGLAYCIYERGDTDVDGYGNHYYNVKNSKAEVVMSLIMMDSNMYYYDSDLGADNGYDHFHENQIAWYEKTVRAIAKEVNGDETKVVPSLAFFHIPLYETEAAYAAAKKEKNILYGSKNEKVASSYFDDNMFEKMLELGSTKGFYFGHDHMNDFCAEYKGVRFTYANTSDHTIYLASKRGGVAISIYEDGSFAQQRMHRFFGMGALKIDQAV